MITHHLFVPLVVRRQFPCGLLLRRPVAGLDETGAAPALLRPLGPGSGHFLGYQCAVQPHGATPAKERSQDSEGGLRWVGRGDAGAGLARGSMDTERHCYATRGAQPTTVAIRHHRTRESRKVLCTVVRRVLLA